MKVHIYTKVIMYYIRTFDSKVKIPIFNRRTLARTGGLHSCVRASSSCH